MFSKQKQNKTAREEFDIIEIFALKETSYFLYLSWKDFWLGGLVCDGGGVGDLNAM